MSEEQAKALNRCKEFEFNELDAITMATKYKPRQPKKKQCDGQEKLF